MKRKVIWVLAILMLLSGCSSMRHNPFGVQAEIDWVDFVKINGKSYTGLYDVVIQDPELVTDEVVGTVNFKVADNVTNPSYKTKDGDAAFLEVGTLLYKLHGYDNNEIIAVKDVQRIGGYKLYVQEDDVRSIRKHYNDLDRASVKVIELYHYGELDPFHVLKDQEVKTFIQYLDDGEDSPNYMPKTQDADPAYYEMVFDVDGPFAYMYSIFDDGEQVYFHPWDTRLVSPEIRSYLNSAQ